MAAAASVVIAAAVVLLLGSVSTADAALNVTQVLNQKGPWENSVQYIAQHGDNGATAGVSRARPPRPVWSGGTVLGLRRLCVLLPIYVPLSVGVSVPMFVLFPPCACPCLIHCASGLFRSLLFSLFLSLHHRLRLRFVARWHTRSVRQHRLPGFIVDTGKFAYEVCATP